MNLGRNGNLMDMEFGLAIGQKPEEAKIEYLEGRVKYLQDKNNALLDYINLPWYRRFMMKEIVK